MLISELEFSSMKGLGLCQAARGDKHFLLGYYPLLGATRSPPRPALPRAGTAGDEQPRPQGNLLAEERQPCDSGDGLKSRGFPGAERCVQVPCPGFAGH